MNKFAKLLDYVFVLRPTLFFPVWTVYAAGYFACRRFAPAAVEPADAGVSSGSVFVLAFLTLFMGGIFILNQICDVATDARNHKLFLIAQRHISPSAAWVETGVLLLTGLVAAFAHGRDMGFLFVAIFLLTGVLYSMPPFQWKDRPVPGLVANACGALLIFAAGWWSIAAGDPGVARHALPYMLAVAAVYLYTTLPDLAGDALAHKMTFGVKYGWRATVLTGTGLELAALAAAALVNDPLILYPALLAAPFFIWAACKPHAHNVSRAIKLPILFLALAICVEVWQYFLILVLVYGSSKWYYRVRFGLRYPSLLPD